MLPHQNFKFFGRQQYARYEWLAFMQISRNGSVTEIKQLEPIKLEPTEKSSV